ncbi:hypothetical protein KIH07_17270 [Hydrogenophaga taeniospiralis]|uniref:hypothetical protein n=1 Tax=Hydrogenophaga taeniospiralis TaxID=65656 RepID=UPI001CFB649A|nr:hypothetical protein [Hydrogenophaga taeniospiralis]MCB4365495.1 hypothetical protein [Hydrogenophaga taeniospiralis]
MKKMRQYLALVVAVVLSATSGVASAWNRTDVGPVIPGDGTYALGSDLQASNTWDDWYWRGKNHNMSMYCSSNAIDCTYSLGRTVTSSYSHLQGTSVAIGLGVNIMAFTAQYQHATTKTHQKTKSSTDSFSNGVTFKGGFYCNPVKVAVRRWKRGSFNGAWFRTGWISGGGNNTVYDWKWKKHGYWTANVAEWHYITFQIARSI